MGDRGFFWVSAAILGTTAVAALLSLRRIKV
jgi:hypothetical protein